MGWCEMLSRGGQRPTGEVVLVSHVRVRLGMRNMRLLGMVRVVRRVLELGHWHSEALMGLPVHHHRLTLVALRIHGVRVVARRLIQRRRTRRGRSVGIEL